MWQKLWRQQVQFGDGGPDFGDFVPRGLQSEGGVGEPGAWWRGMNRKKSKAETTNQPMAFDIFMLSLSRSPYAHNTWTSLLHNTIPTGHTNNSKIVSNIRSLTYLPLGEVLGNTVASWWAHIGNKEIILKIQQHPSSPIENLGLFSVFFML